MSNELCANSMCERQLTMCNELMYGLCVNDYVMYELL